MEELRKSNRRNTGSMYLFYPIIKVRKERFSVSTLIVEKLKINIETDALMFGFKDKKLHVYKEQKESDNYHLAKDYSSTYRFRKY